MEIRGIRRSGHFMRGRHASAGADVASIDLWPIGFRCSKFRAQRSPRQLFVFFVPGCVRTDNMDRHCSFQARFVLRYIISGDPIELCPPNEIDFRLRKVPASPSAGSVSDTFPIGRSIPPPLLVSCSEPRRIPRPRAF
jgi:hypothetical protein